jgi:hypothetical protein
MLDEYTTDKLVELRSLCTDLILETNDTQRRAETLLLMKHIDEELAMRKSRQAA